MLSRRQFIKSSAMVFVCNCGLGNSISGLVGGRRINQSLFSIEERKGRRIVSGQETFHTTYNLAYQAERIGMDIFGGDIYYSHPSENESPDCPSGWFVGNSKKCLDPFSINTPELIKFIYKHFGNDPDLNFVRYWPFSNSARLFFPKYLENKEFHERKLNLLSAISI
jgi:hypothetical protein